MCVMLEDNLVLGSSRLEYCMIVFCRLVAERQRAVEFFVIAAKANPILVHEKT